MSLIGRCCHCDDSAGAPVFVKRCAVQWGYETEVIEGNEDTDWNLEVGVTGADGVVRHNVVGGYDRFHVPNTGEWDPPDGNWYRMKALTYFAADADQIRSIIPGTIMRLIRVPRGWALKDWNQWNNQWYYGQDPPNVHVKNDRLNGFAGRTTLDPSGTHITTRGATSISVAVGMSTTTLEDNYRWDVRLVALRPMMDGLPIGPIREFTDDEGNNRIPIFNNSDYPHRQYLNKGMNSYAIRKTLALYNSTELTGVVGYQAWFKFKDNNDGQNFQPGGVTFVPAQGVMDIPDILEAATGYGEVRTETDNWSLEHYIGTTNSEFDASQHTYQLEFDSLTPWTPTAGSTTFKLTGSIRDGLISYRDLGIMRTANEIPAGGTPPVTKFPGASGDVDGGNIQLRWDCEIPSLFFREVRGPRGGFTYEYPVFSMYQPDRGDAWPSEPAGGNWRGRFNTMGVTRFKHVSSVTMAGNASREILNPQIGATAAHAQMPEYITVRQVDQ